MARRQLTDRTLKALKPAPAGKRYDLMDSVVAGFGVRVTDKAQKSKPDKADQRTFILLTRYPGARDPARRALGNYPALTLEKAREKASKWRDLIDKGIDPRDEEERIRAA